MWNDIDYMDGYRDFTTDPVNYPLADFRAFVDRLHAGGMKYICMTDPGIKIEQGYAPYDDGLVLDLFIKNQSGLVSLTSHNLAHLRISPVRSGPEQLTFQILHIPQLNPGGPNTLSNSMRRWILTEFGWI